MFKFHLQFSLPWRHCNQGYFVDSYPSCCVLLLLRTCVLLTSQQVILMICLGIRGRWHSNLLRHFLLVLKPFHSEASAMIVLSTFTYQIVRWDDLSVSSCPGDVIRLLKSGLSTVKSSLGYPVRSWNSCFAGLNKAFRVTETRKPLPLGKGWITGQTLTHWFIGYFLACCYSCSWFVSCSVFTHFPAFWFQSLTHCVGCSSLLSRANNS